MQRILEGQLSTRKWKDEKSGQDKYSTEIVLQGYNSSLTMLGGKIKIVTLIKAMKLKVLCQTMKCQVTNELDDEIPF